MAGAMSSLHFEFVCDAGITHWHYSFFAKVPRYVGLYR